MAGLKSCRLSAAAIVALLSLLGCRTAEVAEPLTHELAGNEPHEQMAFWYTLAERPVVSNDEAFHGMLLFVDGEDPAADYDERVALLKERGMLPQSFDRPANEAVRRGDLAVAITHILNVRGGVLMRIVGPHPRYATRELEYINVYPRSSPQQTFTGGQYMALIGRIEDVERTQTANSAAR